MKKIKFLTFFAVAILIASLCFFNTGATSVTREITPLINKTADSSNIENGTIVIVQDITSLAQETIGENGGRLAVEIIYSSQTEASVAVRCNVLPAETLTPEQIDGGVSVQITFSIGDVSAFSSLSITSATLTAFPNEPAVSPSPSDESEPSSSLAPVESDDPIYEPTQEPTKRPVVTPERTKDNYVSNNQTQAPPTFSLPPDVTIDPNRTPVPELPAETPEPFEKVSNSPSLSFTIFFLILVILLVIDLFLIYWRKQMGYGVLINNGISRRKIKEDFVNTPENFEDSDIEDELENQE